MFKRMLVGGVLVLLLVSANFAFARQEVSGVGEVILLEGQVLDVNGAPVVGAVVEIWQTDANGVYNHPNDADPAELLPDFQYFGTATTDENGNYNFLTIKPALYEAQRPPHIHVKVKLDGVELLTTQFYFEEDRALFESDGVFQAGGGESLILQPEESTDEQGNPVRLATANLVVAVNGSSGTLALTPAQAEGPYYPVVDFSSYDNDLTSVGQPFTLLNLNTASSEEFLTIPDMGNRMVREFEEYRPYISIEQFRREIGKYVDDAQVAAYEAYVYVPVNINESDAAFLAELANYLSAEEVAYAANYLEAE